MRSKIPQLSRSQEMHKNNPYVQIIENWEDFCGKLSQAESPEKGKKKQKFQKDIGILNSMEFNETIHNILIKRIERMFPQNQFYV